MTTRAFIYARFSSDQQADGDSIRRQVESGTEAIKQKGWTLADTFIDEGASAYKGKNRKEGSALHKFEQEAESGAHSGTILAIENLDRLSRQNPNAARALLGKLLKCGVSVFTWHDNQLYEANKEYLGLDKELILLVTAHLAHEESEKKSKRIKEALANNRAKIEAGYRKAITRNIPSWLSVDDDRNITLNEHRHKVLNEIYDWYIDGVGAYTIVQRLNNRGELPWSHGTKQRAADKDSGWSETVVLSLLRNRSVLGEVRSLGKLLSATYYPQAITADKFNKAQAVRISKRGSGGANKRTSSNLFGGIAKCDECRKSMGYWHVVGNPRKYVAKDGKVTYHKVSPNITLRCDSNRRNHKCNNSQIFKYQLIEDAVLNRLFEVAHTPYLQAENSELKKLTDKLAEAERLISTRQRQIDQLTENLMEVHSKALAQKIVQLESENEKAVEALNDLREAIAREQATPNASDTVAELQALRDQLQSSDDEARYNARARANVALKRLITDMRFHDDGTITLMIGQFTGWLLDKQGKAISWQWNGQPMPPGISSPEAMVQAQANKLK